MGGVMERFESEWRQGRCQLVEKLPRQRLRNLLRRQVAILPLVLLGEPIEMISAPTRTTHACCVGGQMDCDHLQAQRQQSGSRHRLRAHLRHVRPLADSAFPPSYASWAPRRRRRRRRRRRGLRRGDGLMEAQKHKMAQKPV
jgi:hypothetical protein